MNFVMYMRVMYLSLAMFVHKFQALDKQNESKNSKKLFFPIHQCTDWARKESAREAFRLEESREKTTLNDKNN